jgi:hypothetical protein
MILVRLGPPPSLLPLRPLPIQFAIRISQSNRTTAIAFYFSWPAMAAGIVKHVWTVKDLLTAATDL